MARNKSSKSTRGKRQKKTISAKRKNGRQTAKRLTLGEKLAQYLNETLSFENAAVSRLQSRIKETQLEDAKRAAPTTFRGDKRAAK